MKVPGKKTLIISIIGIFIFLASALVLTSKHAEYYSPNKKNILTIYRIPLPFASIGGGSDAPGLIVLKTKAGIPTKIKFVSMVQNTEEPKWNKDSVKMKLQFDWKL